MIVVGIIMLVAGIASYAYGNQMNNNIEMQFKSLLNSGTTNPGSIFITIGVAVAVIGLILLIIGIVKKLNHPVNGESHCPNCGAILQKESVYCGKCGNKIK